MRRRKVLYLLKKMQHTFNTFRFPYDVRQHGRTTYVLDFEVATEEVIHPSYYCVNRSNHSVIYNHLISV